MASNLLNQKTQNLILIFSNFDDIDKSKKDFWVGDDDDHYDEMTKILSTTLSSDQSCSNDHSRLPYSADQQQLLARPNGDVPPGEVGELGECWGPSLMPLA